MKRTAPRPATTQDSITSLDSTTGRADLIRRFCVRMKCAASSNVPSGVVTSSKPRKVTFPYSLPFATFSPFRNTFEGC